MASIRKRNGRFQVQVRSGDHPPQSRTFSQRIDAVRWARETEIARERNLFGFTQSLKVSVRAILERYSREVTPRKRGAKQELNRVRRLMADPIANVSLHAFTPAVAAQFRDRRIKDGVRACAYDLVILGHALKVAQKEWGYPLNGNPVAEIAKPRSAASRNRRLEAGEYEKLCGAAAQGQTKYLWPLVNLAIETAMRQSELLSLTWENIDIVRSTAFLPLTKNGDPRTVPLSSEAISWLRQFPGGSGRVVPVSKVAVRQAWERLLKRAKIVGLHFHDLRHEAISRFFERGLSVPEVALISGHRDYRMLARYTHLRAADIATKLKRQPVSAS